MKNLLQEWKNVSLNLLYIFITANIFHSSLYNEVGDCCNLPKLDLGKKKKGNKYLFKKRVRENERNRFSFTQKH